MAHAPESDAQLHFVEYVNRTTSYAVGSSILIDAVFNRPFTATGTKLHIELAGGKIVQADLDTTSDGERILKYSYTILSSDDTSTVNVVDIVGILKKKPKTALSLASGDIRDSATTTAYQIRSITNAEYGADPTGVEESGPAIQLALDAGPGCVYIPAGTYKCSQKLLLRKGVDLKCERGSLLDFSHNASAASIVHCMAYEDSSLQALPDLASDVSGTGAYQLTFASDPDLSIEDVIIAYNPTDSSYSSHRASYRDGDMLQIATESGTAVTLKNGTSIPLPKASYDFYKIKDPYQGTIDGLNIKGINDGSNSNVGLHILMGVHVRITNCRFYNSSNTGLSLYRCFGVYCDNVEAADNFANEFSFEYGIKVLNSYRVVVNSSFMSAARHGYVTGTGGATGDIPCRHCIVQNSHTFAHTSQKSLNFHGNSEHCIVANCVLDGGMDFAGDYLTIDGNIILSKGWDDKPALSGTEFKGFNFQITNNRLVQRWTGAGAADCLSTLFGMGALMDSGGTMVISGNILEVHNSNDKLTSSVIKVRQAGYVGSDPIRVVITDNVIAPDSTHLWGINVDIETAGSTPFESVVVSGNSFKNCGPLQVTNSAGANEYSGYFVKCTNNTGESFDNASQGVSIVAVRDLVVFEDNSFSDFHRYFIIQGVSSSIKTNTVVAKGNTFYNSPWGLTGSAELDSSIRYRYTTNLIHRDYNIVNNTRRLTVADGTQITEGGTITGNTSGATATVFQVLGNDLAIKLSESATPFAGAGETITDDTTGNTTTTSAGSAVNQKFSYRIHSDVTNANRDNDVAFTENDNTSTLAASVAGVSSDVTTI